VAVTPSSFVQQLAFAQQCRRAVRLTLRDAQELPEEVGVADVDEDHGWLDLYVADGFGADVQFRISISMIDEVWVLDHDWGCAT
jgi:hypothetical protein